MHNEQYPMVQSVHPIFRPSALTFQQNNQPQNKPPSVFSSRILLCIWGVLCLLIGAGTLTLLTTVPTYVDTSGVVITMNATSKGQANMVLLVEATQAVHLKHNAPLQVEAWTPTVHFSSTLYHPDANILKEHVIQQRSGVNRSSLPHPLAPSIALIAAIPANISAHLNTGQRIHTRIFIGNATLLSLLQNSRG